MNFMTVASSYLNLRRYNYLDIYSGEKLAFEIERTRSRLLEMQSDEYLNRRTSTDTSLREASKHQESI